MISITAMELAVHSIECTECQESEIETINFSFRLADNRLVTFTKPYLVGIFVQYLAEIDFY